MALILNIESSTEVCSVALAKNGELVCLKEDPSGSRHSERLTVYIEAVLRDSGVLPSDLDAIAVSMGPGSYTGLRIGVSAAKGLAYATGKPLIAVGTLDALANYTASHASEFEIANPENLLYCPMIDARRMEVFTAVFDSKGNIAEPVSAKIIVPDSFLNLLNDNMICFFGNGSAKCHEDLNHSNALFMGPEKTSARFMCQIADMKYNNKVFEDVAYFEPFYLKDFIATVPKNKVI